MTQRPKDIATYKGFTIEMKDIAGDTDFLITWPGEDKPTLHATQKTLANAKRRIDDHLKVWSMNAPGVRSHEDS